MFGSTVLEIGLGLVFFYLVLSFICTSINEYIAQMLGLRSANLVQTIHGLFTGKDRHVIAWDILAHPQITSLSRKESSPGTADDPGAKPPSSIPASAFSSALMDLLGVKEPVGANTSVNLNNVIRNAKFDDETLTVLEPLINSANNNLDQARRNIETWFDQAMQRSSGWYKRQLQVVTLSVAFIVVLIANADTIMIANRLWQNPAERAQVEGLAKNATDPNKIDEATQRATLALIGWVEPPVKKAERPDPRQIPEDPSGWIKKLFGLLITTFAVSLGAPFWFDKLSVIMNIRSAGKTADSDKKTRVPSSDQSAN